MLCSTRRANCSGLLGKKPSRTRSCASPLTRSRKTAVAIALHAGLHDRQSAEADNAKRKQLISEIERKADRGRRPADHLLQPVRLLLAAPGQGLDDDGEQHHQQFSASVEKRRRTCADRRPYVLRTVAETLSMGIATALAGVAIGMLINRRFGA